MDGVTSRLLANGNAPVGFHTVYTVPADRTLVLRRGVLLNGGAAKYAGWYCSSGGAIGWLSDLTNVALNETRESGYAILGPGDLLGVLCEANTFTYHASGSLLHGAPT